MVRRKIQRLEIVVIRLDHRAFGHRVTEVLKHADNFVLRANDGMLGAKGTADTRQGDVDGRLGLCAWPWRQRSLDPGFNLRLDFIYTLTDLSLRVFWSGLQPELVDLGENAIFSGEPAVTKGFPLIFILDGGSFLLQRSQKFFDRGVEGLRREVF